MANKDNERMSSLLLSFLNFLTRSSTPSRSNRSALCPVGRVPAGGPERGFRRHSSPLSKAGGDWQPSPTTKKTRIQPRSRLRRLFLSLLWQHGEAEEGPVIGGYGFDRIEGGQYQQSALVASKLLRCCRRSASSSSPHLFEQTCFGLTATAPRHRRGAGAAAAEDDDGDAWCGDGASRLIACPFRAKWPGMREQRQASKRGREELWKKKLVPRHFFLRARERETGLVAVPSPTPTRRSLFLFDCIRENEKK